jgi:hypothetical protein
LKNSLSHRPSAHPDDRRRSIRGLGFLDGSGFLLRRSFSKVFSRFRDATGDAWRGLAEDLDELFS